MEQPIKILYVDDYPLDRELVRDALEKEHGGFQVVEATSRADFEAQLTAGTFDLVLSDFNILGFEGLQVIDAVHAKDPRVPVVIVTGTGSEEIAVEAMKHDAADYVIKSPKHIQHLPRTIYAVLEKKRLKEERTQAEAQLQHQAAILSVLLNSPQETVALLDVNGVVLNINLNGAKRFGLSPQEMVGKTVYDLIPEPVSSERREIITGVMRTGQSAHFDDARQGMHFSNSVYPVNDPQSGELLGVAIFALDITARKQTEVQLNEQLDELRRWHTVTLDREARILNLKREVNELLRRLNEPIRYTSAEDL